MTTRTKGRALGILLVIAAISAALFGLWAGQRRLIYIPDPRAPTIATAGAGWRDATFDTADGLTLGAWYRPPQPGRPIVIVLNGNAGSRAGRVPLGNGLASAGLGVLLTDYRGYGGNPGRPHEEGLAADARAAVHFVRITAREAPLVYFGESLGAAVAIRLAEEAPPAALVLRSPFLSLEAVGQVHYPWLPVGALLKDRYPSADRIGGIAAPSFVIAGDSDSIVPVEQSQALFDLAPEPKRLLIIPGAEHNDPALTSGEEMISQIVDFLSDVETGDTGRE